MFVASVLAADGLVHAYWTTGARWPASDAETLSQLMLGAGDVPFTPIVVGPLAAILLLGALAVTGYANRRSAIGRLLPRRLLKAGMLAMTAAFALRALAGIAMVFMDTPGAAFFWLNLLVYTPLCWALAAATVVTLGAGTGVDVPAERA